MKRILIFQENVAVVEVYDDDKTDLSDYTEKLSQILQSANVTILKTTTSSVIIRPSKVSSILVYNVDDPPIVDNPSKQKSKPKKAKDDHEDIITDAD